MSHALSASKGFIFRITHRNNVPWILVNGLHCARSAVQDPGFVSIGNADLIGKRRDYVVQGPIQAPLGDFVPFYFTPWSPMLLNIVTGWGGVTKRAKEDIVFLVSSIPRLREQGVPHMFSDRHAYLRLARFGVSQEELETLIPWQQLRDRDFKRDPDNPEKVERYQAEALVHSCVPTSAILGIVCHNQVVSASIRSQLPKQLGQLRVEEQPHWYF